MSNVIYGYCFFLNDVIFFEYDWCCDIGLWYVIIWDKGEFNVEIEYFWFVCWDWWEYI